MRHYVHFSADEVINVAFGMAATLLAVVMIWQAAKYAARHNHNHSHYLGIITYCIIGIVPLKHALTDSTKLKISNT